MNASDWISVKDSLPELSIDAGSFEFSGEVLLYLGNGIVITARLVRDKADNTMIWSVSRGSYCNLEEATHWQEIVLPK
jgi:hypothetical protein